MSERETEKARTEKSVLGSKETAHKGSLREDDAHSEESKKKRKKVRRKERKKKKGKERERREREKKRRRRKKVFRRWSEIFRSRDLRHPLIELREEKETFLSMTWLRSTSFGTPEVS